MIFSGYNITSGCAKEDNGQLTITRARARANAHALSGRGQKDVPELVMLNMCIVINCFIGFTQYLLFIQSSESGLFETGYFIMFINGSPTTAWLGDRRRA